MQAHTAVASQRALYDSAGVAAPEMRLHTYRGVHPSDVSWLTEVCGLEGGHLLQPCLSGTATRRSSLHQLLHGTELLSRVRVRSGSGPQVLQHAA